MRPSPTQSELTAIASRVETRRADLNRWHVEAGCRDRLIGPGDVLAAMFADLDARLAKEVR